MRKHLSHYGYYTGKIEILYYTVTWFRMKDIIAIILSHRAENKNALSCVLIWVALLNLTVLEIADIGQALLSFSAQTTPNS